MLDGWLQEVHGTHMSLYIFENIIGLLYIVNLQDSKLHVTVLLPICRRTGSSSYTDPCILEILLTALLLAIRRMGSPPYTAFIFLRTGLYASGMTSIGTPSDHVSPRVLESFLGLMWKQCNHLV